MSSLTCLSSFLCPRLCPRGSCPRAVSTWVCMGSLQQEVRAMRRVTTSKGDRVVNNPHIACPYCVPGFSCAPTGFCRLMANPRPSHLALGRAAGDVVGAFARRASHIANERGTRIFASENDACFRFGARCMPAVRIRPGPVPYTGALQRSDDVWHAPAASEWRDPYVRFLAVSAATERDTGHGCHRAARYFGTDGRPALAR